jgi:Bacterial Ig domain
MILVCVALSTQSVLSQTPLISTGAVWKYLDTGVDPGAGWQAHDYDDAAWGTGPAPLGYGDGDEATTNSFGPDPNNKFITTYYRHAFNLANASEYTNLSLRLLRDDGGVVYLNGVEIFRSNLPTNSLTATTLASTNVAAIDETTNFHATAVNPGLLSNDLNVVAVEIHQVNTNSSDISFDLALTGNYVPVEPVVRITSPVDGATFSRGDATIYAAASDSLGSVVRVEFFGNGSKLGEDVTPPYSLTWPNIPLGSHAFTAVAVNNSGLSATSAPVTITVLPALIHSAAEWRYLDDGSNQGTAWRNLGFDDSGWSNGMAQLGYGDGDEATSINGGPGTNGVISAITTYFRHVFEVDDTSTLSNLVLRLLRDDGGIVYLNGTEIFRSNMPQGPGSFTNFAASIVNVPQESQFYSTNVPLGLLVNGSNVVAVEIHQGNDTSSDVSFNLELLPNIPPSPPTIAMTSPSNNATFTGPAMVTVTAAATDFDGTIARVELFVGSNVVGMDVSEPYSLTASNVAAGTYQLRTVATDDSGMSATSAPVTISVLSAPLAISLLSTGAMWKYIDDGADQGTSWIQAGFDDSSWPTGTAKFGTGDVAVTSIRIGPANITTYFRHSFVASNVSAYTNLYFRVLRDDGVVAYLNSTEIFRMNMPTGAINYLTPVPATQPVGGTNEFFYFPTNISPGVLINGTNLLAVELHQTASTSDAGFDLGLVGLAPAGSLPISIMIEHSGTNVVVRWAANDMLLERAAVPTGPWGTVTPTPSSPYTISAAEASQYYRLRRP